MNLDLDILRTLVLARQLGGFGRAAERVGRSQPAVSQQLRRLEDQIGEPLFRKDGRGLAPTDAGEILLSYARRMLDLNDEALSVLRGRAVAGRVRLGLPADFAESWLPGALGRFQRAHPAVEIEVVVDRNRLLVQRLDLAELDLVLTMGQGARDDAERLGTLSPHWIGAAAPDRDRVDGGQVPLVVSDAPCFFRKRAISALDDAGVPWRIAFTSPTLGGIWAAVEAGLGVTVRTSLGLPDGLRMLTPAGNLPPLYGPPIDLCLHGPRTQDGPLARLRAIVADEVRLRTGSGEKRGGA